MKKVTETLNSKHLHVLFHSRDAANAEVLDEHFGHIGGEESGQGWAKVDVLHAEAQ